MAIHEQQYYDYDDDANDDDGDLTGTIEWSFKGNDRFEKDAKFEYKTND